MTPRFVAGFILILASGSASAGEERSSKTDRSRLNVLFIISDDLTSTALSCYGNAVCSTPNIDRLAETGMRFTQAYCQGTYCGPSRASFMSGYYPHATGVLGYKNPRPQIGDRATWSQHFKNNGYYAARVSKIFHMGVPGGVEDRGPGRDYNGADDQRSWRRTFQPARDQNGALRAMVKLWKETRMERSPLLAATPSLLSKQMAMTWCTPMG